MLFHSFYFIFLFLPLTLFLYFKLGQIKKEYSKVFLIGASLVFYGFFNLIYVFLITLSILINYGFVKKIEETKSKKLLITGIIFNVGMLVYYKYMNFFIESVNYIFTTDYNLLNIFLPLGISFFTFQQIAYLVDTYKKEIKEHNLIDYSLFILFFPQLVAGPIIQHKDIVPQFHKDSVYFFNKDNFLKGVFLFSIGLFKKVVIADNLAPIVDSGYAASGSLNFIEALITQLSFIFQLYFDYSGYIDMALGIGLMFNILIPIDFNSPLKARNIKEFWKTWHITLGKFLEKYLFLPLTVGKKYKYRREVGTFVVMFISGVWHGSGITFFLWGLAHGVFATINNIWIKNRPFIFHPAIAITIVMTIHLITLSLFRAENISQATNIISAIFLFKDFSFESIYFYVLHNIEYFIFFSFVFYIVFFKENSMKIIEGFKINSKYGFYIGVLIGISLLFMTNEKEFIYFQF